MTGDRGAGVYASQFSILQEPLKKLSSSFYMPSLKEGLITKIDIKLDNLFALTVKAYSYIKNPFPCTLVMSDVKLNVYGNTDNYIGYTQTGTVMKVNSGPNVVTTFENNPLTVKLALSFTGLLDTLGALFSNPVTIEGSVTVLVGNTFKVADLPFVQAKIPTKFG